MGRSSQPLTPLEFVDLGLRLTEEQVEELGIAQLLNGALAVMRSGLRSAGFALEELGVAEDVLAEAVVEQLNMEKGAWGERKRLLKAVSGGSNQFPHAAQPPTRKGGSPKGVSIPEALSVVTGSRRRYPKTKAVVVQSGWQGEILVLGDPNRSWVYGSWSRASKPILDYKDHNFWDLQNPSRIDPRLPLL